MNFRAIVRTARVLLVAALFLPAILIDFTIGFVRWCTGWTQERAEAIIYRCVAAGSLFLLVGRVTSLSLVYGGASAPLPIVVLEVQIFDDITHLLFNIVRLVIVLCVLMMWAMIRVVTMILNDPFISAITIICLLFC